MTTVKDIWAEINRPMKQSKTYPKPAAVKTDPTLAKWLGVKNDAPISAPKKNVVPKRKARVMDRALTGWLHSGSLRDRVGPSAAGSGLASSCPISAPEEPRSPTSRESALPQSNQPHRRATGLENVLQALKGGKGERVIDKTRESWTSFKERDAEVAQELEAYKKDKNRYTDKVAFLDRTDVREWEADMARKRKR